MEAVSTIFTRIRELVLPRSAEQRLQLIQDTAAMKQDEAAVRETPLAAAQLAVEEAYGYGLPAESSGKVGIFRYGCGRRGVRIRI